MPVELAVWLLLQRLVDRPGEVRCRRCAVCTVLRQLLIEHRPTNGRVIVANGSAILVIAPELRLAGGQDAPSIPHRGGETTGCARPTHPLGVPSARYRALPGDQSSTVMRAL